MLYYTYTYTSFFGYWLLFACGSDRALVLAHAAKDNAKLEYDNSE